MKNIKILIIGGTGFIGYHLVTKCLKLRWKVTSISLKKPKKKRKLKSVIYILCDISHKKKLHNKVKNIIMW
jgi:nucleoside-diphosphate-sugar epimerase